MRDIMNIGVVNFNADWGNKDKNLQHIAEYTEAAGKQGCEFLVFPETALTGYDDDSSTNVREEKMHVRLAETIPGPATEEISKIAVKYGMYVVFGMAELDAEDQKTVYNSAAIIHPDGTAEAYRKLHLPFTEGNWAVRGEDPVLIDTPWGPVGISICYDTYCFPEIIRFSRAMGARLHLNVTAAPINECTKVSSRMTINTYSMINYMFIASANLCGRDHDSWFNGGSSVVGPEANINGSTYPRTWVGTYFEESGCDIAGLKLGTIDLEHADRTAEIPIFRGGNGISPDFRPELYSKMQKEIAGSAGFNKK